MMCNCWCGSSSSCLKECNSNNNEPRGVQLLGVSEADGRYLDGVHGLQLRCWYASRSSF